MLSIITNNPYRVLGVYSNSSTKEIVSNEGKMKAFLKVGRAVSFPVDFSSFLPAIERNEEIVANAKSQIALPNEKLKFAQFWFIKLDNIDDIAFNHLTSGDYHQALVLWGKKDTLSSLQNRTVLYLMLKNWTSAISYAEKLYASYANEFGNKIDLQANANKESLINQFVDCLISEKVDLLPVKNSITDSDWIAAINNKTSKPIIDKLEKALETAKQSKSNGSTARLNAGNKLMSIVKTELPKLKGVLSQLQYQVLADKLANEILQCGIDYFNDSEDDDAPHKAMPIQKYALTIAVGSVAKDRCKENVDILQKIINSLPPKEVTVEAKAINKELEKFCKLPDKISHSVTLLNATKPHVQAIKNKLGSTNSFYLKISTQVVGNALHNVIEEVNAAMSSLESRRSPYLTESPTDKLLKLFALKQTIEEAWKATRLMDVFDLEPEFRTRYQTNRSSLKSLCDQIGVSTSTYTSSTRSTSTRSSTSSYAPSRAYGTSSSSSSSSNDTNWGCIIAAIIGFIIFIIAMAN